jgi:hypothetical protein
VPPERITHLNAQEKNSDENENALALGVVAFTALGEPVVLSAAEPVRLTGTQMDAITAGAVAVGVGAWATCRRLHNTYTYASTSTGGFSTPQRQC